MFNISDMKNLITFFVFFMFLSGDASAHPLDQLERGETHQVRQVIDGDTLTLDNGKSIRLLGIQAPEISHKITAPSQPFGMAASRALSDLTLHKKITLYYGTTKKDRYHRILAQLQTEDGKWVQEELLKTGMAMVYSFPDNRGLVEDMLIFERTARKNKKGLWDHPYYQIRDAHRPNSIADDFQLVEGTVYKLTPTSRFVYINFEKDWKTDFTILIEPDLYATLNDPRFLPQNIKGKRIRIRGRVHQKNGPMIELTHPEQLEFLN